MTLIPSSVRLAAVLALPAWALLAGPSAAQSLLTTHVGPTVDGLFGESLANAGDVDGDGVDDLIVGSPGAFDGSGMVRITSGRTGLIIREVLGVPSENLGRAVAGVGDMDGDGFVEVAYSATGAVALSSGVVVYDPVRVWNENSGALLHTFWSLSNEQQGWSLSGGGDGDGDGRTELLIGAPNANVSGLPDTGRVLRMRNDAGLFITSVVAHGDQAGQRMGWDVAWIGDVDDSGVDALATSSPYRDEIGLPGAADVGRVHVLRATGATLWSQKGPTQEGGRFGWSVSGGVDHTGDGLPDVIVGSPYYDASRGRIAVLRGHNGAFHASRVGDNAGDQLGWDVTPALVDGEAVVLAGAPGDGETGGFTLIDPGVLHRLSSANLSTEGFVKGGASWGHLGRTVATLGDVNQDGTSEWAVGQSFPITFQTDAPGSVHQYDGATHEAAWSSLGSGLAGTLGVPQLTPDVDPVLGSLPEIAFGNSAGTPTPAVLFVGLSEIAQPFKGGTLHVVPLLTLSLPVLPTAGLQLPFAVPWDFTLSGFELLMQGAQADGAAPAGVSLTPGLSLLFGV